jgi:hypothetical protein
MLSDDLDLSGAHPAHWAEARRRIAVVQSFVALDAPTTADLVSHAAQLSMSTEQFRRLVRAWKLHGDAGKLPGIRPARPLKRRTYNQLRQKAAAIMMAVIGEMEGRRAAEICEEIRLRCDAAGTDAPSTATIYAAIKDHRSDQLLAGSQEPATLLVVASCWVSLPLAVEGRIVRPKLALAALAPAGQIIAWRWSGFMDRRLEVLTDVFSQSSSSASAQLPIRLHIADEPWARSAIERIRREGGAVDDIPFGSAGVRDVASLIGRKIGEVPISLKYFGETTASLLRDRRDKPLSSTDMLDAISNAVERHNGRRPTSTPFRICTHEADCEIASWLSNLRSNTTLTD